MAKPKPLTIAQRRKIVQAAIRLFDDEGICEVDEPWDAKELKKQISAPALTRAGLKENGGAYVKAWVWVEFDEMKI